MGKGRLEAFSDGVIAIIITIMVLELKVPHATDWASLLELWPVFFSYLLSFVFVGIYWNNHHHLLHTAHQVSAAILWSNLHLLFWLSLIPFSTAYMGENHFAQLPVAIYGVVLFMAGLAYYVLVRALIAQHGPASKLAVAIGKDIKGKASVIFYLVAIFSAFYLPQLSLALYVLVALMWLIPDRRIEQVLN